jgi:hypothetical protein
MLLPDKKLNKALKIADTEGMSLSQGGAVENPAFMSACSLGASTALNTGSVAVCFSSSRGVILGGSCYGGGLIQGNYTVRMGT